MATINKAICNAIRNASEADKAAISNAIENFANKYFRTWRTITNSNTSFATLLLDVSEIVDARWTTN